MLSGTQGHGDVIIFKLAFIDAVVSSSQKLTVERVTEVLSYIIVTPVVTCKMSLIGCTNLMWYHNSLKFHYLMMHYG